MLGTYCHWRFNYQEGRCWNPIVIGDSIIKRGDVGILLSLEIQLSRGEMLGTYCHWGFNYQEGRCWNPIVIGDSIIKDKEDNEKGRQICLSTTHTTVNNYIFLSVTY
jgi:hypothetical protein